MDVRTALTLALTALVACGGDDSPATDAPPPIDAALPIDAAIDAPGVPAFPCGPTLTTAWQRCAGNPIVRPGRRFADGNLELSIGDPNVIYDAEERLWKAWWSSGAALTPTASESHVNIMYAQSADGIAWDVQLEPALRSGTDPLNWDDSKVETPTVLKVATNPPDRRYVMFYAGGNDVDYPHTATLAYTWYQIGVAFSTDGRRFTRMPAAESPYTVATSGFRKIDGLALLARDVFPAALGAANGVVADPELVVDGDEVRLLFSSLATAADRTTYLAYGVSGARVTSLATPRLAMTPTNPVLPGAAQPSAIEVDGQFEVYVVYDSAADDALMPSVFNPYYGIWKHTSSDLVTFSARAGSHDFSMADGPAEERYGWVKAGDVVYADGIRRFYYPTFRSDAVPAGFYCPVRHGAVTPLPPGAIENVGPGLDVVPGIIALSVAARR
ncbi:MAG: hypothetical protein JNK64_41235 [Myxococcales bacterium]|nr:hypothetical protein [Myxococcales bacterium]